MADTSNNPNRDNLNGGQPDATEIEPMPVAAEEPSSGQSQPGPDTAAEADVAGKPAAKRMPRLRARKSLKQSIIRRICKVPSKDSSMEPNGDAEVVYTNSQFGQMADPCIRSACSSCTLARPRRGFNPKGKASAKVKSKSKTRSTSKRSSTVNKRRLQLCRVKRQRENIGDRRFVAKSLLNIDQAQNIPTSKGCMTTGRHCLCTEVNGQIFKLMDLPTNLFDENSLVITVNRAQPTKPRWATKRNIGKRPSNGRK